MLGVPELISFVLDLSSLEVDRLLFAREFERSRLAPAGIYLVNTLDTHYGNW